MSQSVLPVCGIGSEAPSQANVAPAQNCCLTAHVKSCASVTHNLILSMMLVEAIDIHGKLCLTCCGSGGSGSKK